MGWMRTDVNFPITMARFILPRKDILQRSNELRKLDEGICSALHECMNTKEEDKVEALSMVVRLCVEAFRPELSSCVVHYLNLNPEYQHWEIYIIHPSLPKVPFGEKAPSMWLDPEHEKGSPYEMSKMPR